MLRSLGELTAREMLLSAVVLNAAEMKLRGFLNQVVPVASLVASVQAVAERIAALAPQATRLNKQSFRALTPISIAQDATKLIADAYRYAPSDEHREGVVAFMEKRPARFDG